MRRTSTGGTYVSSQSKTRSSRRQKEKCCTYPIDPVPDLLKRTARSGAQARARAAVNDVVQVAVDQAYHAVRVAAPLQVSRERVGHERYSGKQDAVRAQCGA